MREFSMDAHLESSGHCQFLSHVRSNLATGLQNSHGPHTQTPHTHTHTHTLTHTCSELSSRILLRSTCKNTSITPDRNGSVKRPEKGYGAIIAKANVVAKKRKRWRIPKRSSRRFWAWPVAIHDDMKTAKMELKKQVRRT